MNYVPHSDMHRLRFIFKAHTGQKFITIMTTASFIAKAIYFFSLLLFVVSSTKTHI